MKKHHMSRKLYLLSICYIIYCIQCSEDLAIKRKGKDVPRSNVKGRKLESAAEVVKVVHPRTDIKSKQKRDARGRQNGIVSQDNATHETLFRAILTQLETLCPAEGLCNSQNITNSGDDTKRCCLNCSCDTSCHRSGRCCADRQATNNSIGRYVPGVNTECLKPPNQNQQVSYEFVRVCPVSSAAADKVKCHGAEGDEHSVLNAETLPVFDKANVKNYWNVHCAVCNGASLKDLTMWLVRYTCNESINAMLDSEQGQSEFESELTCSACGCHVIPPQEPSVEDTQCYPNIINTCNTTGLWGEYDSFLEEACSYLHLHYEHRTGSATIRFQNIFCALCNGISDDELSRNYTDCTADKPSAPFATILRYVVPDVNLQQTHGCQPHEAMDPISGTCRDVVCAFPLAWDVNSKTCIGSKFFRQVLYQIPFKAIFRFGLSLSVMSVVPMDIRYRHSAVQKDRSRLCGYEVHYKIEKSASNMSEWLESPTLFLDEIITEAYILVSITEDFKEEDISKDDKGYEYYKSSIAKYDKHSMMSPVKEIVPERFDPWMLLPRTDPHVVTVNKSFISNPSLETKLYFYDNSYTDHVLMIMEGVTGDYFDCDTQQYPTIYDKFFMACPAFQYALQDYAIERNQMGIKLVDRNVQFDFGEFLSINKSHVRICMESVLHKVKPISIATIACPVCEIMMFLAVGLGAFFML